jgi:hypothetical protein
MQMSHATCNLNLLCGLGDEHGQRQTQPPHYAFTLHSKQKEYTKK